MTRRISFIMVIFAAGLMLGLAASAWTAERHPEIRAAQRNLASAKSHLEAAAHDFGGHRVKAIEFIDKAQGELRDALQFDKK